MLNFEELGLIMNTFKEKMLDLLTHIFNIVYQIFISIFLKTYAGWIILAQLRPQLERQTTVYPINLPRRKVHIINFVQECATLQLLRAQ